MVSEVSPLIYRVTEFLEDISEKFKIIDLDRLKKDKKYFEKFYLSLKDNLYELKKLKDEMEQRGFDSPYFALGMSRYGMFGSGYKREDVEDQRDVARHKMFFRTDASFKKGTFERTKSAIASHNIALGHLEEYVSFVCYKCGKETQGKEALRIIEENREFICPKCKSNKVKLVANEHGIYRIEIIPHLVYGGEFTKEISKFTSSERMAYRELIEVLREKKRGKIKSATVTFRIKEKGRWITKKEQVEVKDSKLDYEGILRSKYGRIIIEHIRYHHERSILVSGRYNRQALAIAYTKFLKEVREKILEYFLSKEVDLEKLRTYEKLRQSVESKLYNAYPYLDIRLIEEGEEIMEEFDEKLRELGFMDEKGNLSPDLVRAIELRREIRKKTLVKIPKALFAWDIFRFLLIKPYRERRYASIFPGLQPIPEKEQLKSVLESLEDEEIVNAIRMFIDTTIISIKAPHKVISKKFEIENILQDYLKVTSSRAVGGIALYITSDLDLKTSAEVVGCKVEELKEVLKVIVRLGRKDIIPDEKFVGLEDIKSIEISQKAREFLELVR